MRGVTGRCVLDRSTSSIIRRAGRSGDARRAAAAHNVEALEQRTMMYAWTSQEVYLSELVNRARANPTAEGTRLGINLTTGLTSGEIARLVAQEPLALNQFLTSAARSHSQDMAVRNFFDHINPDGLDPTARAHAAGYTGTAGENIGAGYASIDAAYLGWMQSVGHRKNILSLHSNFDDVFKYTEFGAGMALNAGGTYNNYYTTTFGYQGTSPVRYVLGVAFSDADSNNFYGIGEGMSNVRIDVATTAAPGTVVGTYTTDSAGNYQIGLPNGSYQATFTRLSDGFSVIKSFTISGQNKKVDAKASELSDPNPPPPPPADDYADTGEWSTAASITIDGTTGNGVKLGSLETSGDTDLFTFVATRTGTTTVTMAHPTGAFAARVRAYNSTQGLIINGVAGTGNSSVATFSVVAGQRYYLLALASNGTSTGTYAITIQGPVTPPPPTDDFANSGQWSSASAITLDGTTGNGLQLGNIEAAADSDLFTFIATRTGSTTLTMANSAGAYTAVLRGYSSAQALLGTGVTGAGNSSVLTLSLVAGQRYYLLAAAANGSSTGTYAITIAGPVTPPPPPADDFADAAEWTQASSLSLDATDGNGTQNGSLEADADTDLFSISAPRSGTTSFAVAMTAGGAGMTLRIYNAAHVEIGANTGTSGAALTLTLTAGQTYFILVGGVSGSLTGDYTLTLTGPGPGGDTLDDDFGDTGQWQWAGEVPLNESSGTGLRVGYIETAGDTDLFRFTAIESGTITLTLQDPGGLHGAMVLSLFDADHNLLMSGEPGGGLGLDSVIEVQVTEGETFFLLAHYEDPEAVGIYTLSISGAAERPVVVGDAQLAMWGARVSAQWIDGSLRLTYINGAAETRLAQYSDGQWTSLSPFPHQYDVTSEIESWVDVDGRPCLAVRADQGLILLREIEPGSWVARNLNLELPMAPGIWSDLEVVQEAAGRVTIAGLNIVGDLVLFQQATARKPNGNYIFRWRNVTQKDLEPRNLEMPEIASELTSYVTPAGTVNFIFLDPDGDIQMFYRAKNRAAYNLVNLSDQVGTQPLVGELSVMQTRRNFIQIMGTNEAGHVIATTYDGDRWTTRDVTRRLNSFSFQVQSITTYVNNNGMGFVAGIKEDGTISIYRFNPTRAAWAKIDISLRPPDFRGMLNRLYSVVDADTGNIDIFGTLDSNHIVRWTSEVGLPWTYTDISIELARNGG